MRETDVRDMRVLCIKYISVSEGMQYETAYCMRNACAKGCCIRSSVSMDIEKIK